MISRKPQRICLDHADELGRNFSSTGLASKLDMYTTFWVSIFLVIIPLFVCEDDCPEPHEVERAQVSNPSDEGYAVGSTVTYKCDYGFIIGGSVKTSRCIRDPTTDEPVWTQPEFTCNPRSCGDPGNVENARRVGSRFTFPNNVEYICNEGYRLSGAPRRYCEASGVWSGKLPSCRAITCERPEDPENGRVVYTSLTYNSELRYECNRDLQLSSKESRLCSSDGKWTGTKPICREIECEMPDSPEFGTAELVGNKPKVGSIVIYKCDPGRRLVGSGNSKCLKTSEWTFPTPLCVEPCVVPSVANGELGKYEEEYKRYRWRTVFKPVAEGEILDENEQVMLKCDSDYVPNGQPLREITITCQRGQLSPEPKCVTTTCLDDPPSIENGRAVVRNRYHGYIIWYNCYSGFDKGESGKVECVYGSWIGDTPTCVDNRCDRSSLNYPGLVNSEGYVYNGQSFVPTCRAGYEVTESSDKRIYCNKRQWSGNLPPCTAAQCRMEELAGFNGLVLQGSRTLDDGEWLQPTCSEGFEFSSKVDSRIYCRGGVWQGNLPPCSPAHCSNNPPVPEHGRIKSFRAIAHGSSVEYECLSFYRMDGRGNVVCNHGQWSGSPPTCKDTRCYLKDLTEKEGVDVTDDGPIYSGRTVNIVCIRGYTLRYPEVHCENGVWRTENLLSPCQENDCEVKHIPNGEILKERRIPIKNFWGTVVGTDTVREPADIGSSESSGAVLYVECNGEYGFQGEEIGEQVKVTCRRGEWVPMPMCLLPGKPPETELPNVGEASDSAMKKLAINQSIIISDRIPYSRNNSAEEDLEDITSISDNNFTDNIEANATDTTVSPSCSCNYIVQDRFLLAHDGKKLIKYGDEIPSGTVIAFYCNSTGFFRLRGPPSLKCPTDCDWHSSMFPSCLSPRDKDVIIRVISVPSENMKVGPGGVLSVVPGTRLELTCRAKSGYRQYVDWTAPAGSGFKDSAVQKDIFKMMYTVPEASPLNSGKYTCFKTSGEFHAVHIVVEENECPEIEEIEKLTVSYSQNRKFGSRATFHCFSPYMRNGPSYVTCEASGFWSGPPSSCYLPTCSMESLYDIIPEGVVPLVDGDIDENLPFGYEIRLGCDEDGKVLRGGNTALCSTEGKWRTGNDFECVQGCTSLAKKNGSELVISPNKDFYSMGESIIFSCPKGKDLTIDVQRILCFQGHWTPNTIPDCH